MKNARESRVAIATLQLMLQSCQLSYDARAGVLIRFYALFLSCVMPPQARR